MESESEPAREELLLLLPAKDAAITALTALAEQLSSRCEQLAARVEELERQLGRDSSNSGRPPSCDAPLAKPAPKRFSRTRSGRGPGKQDGAPGTTLKPVAVPDNAVSSDPDTCCGCGEALADAPALATVTSQLDQEQPDAHRHRDDAPAGREAGRGREWNRTLGHTSLGRSAMLRFRTKYPSLTVGVMNGDIDFAPVGALLGDPGRARVLAALADGRALPASVLATEAGVSASTASAHLAKLVDGRLLQVERHGRHRYYRLAGPGVATALEAVAALSPSAPVRSLREGNRGQALRAARTCYDHLAGRLGVALMQALLNRDVLRGRDGTFDPAQPGHDRLSGPGTDVEYRLTETGLAFLTGLGVTIPAGRRPLIRYCVDWSEQQHHLAGRLGAALLDHALDADWVRRTPTRAIRLTDTGRHALHTHLGIAP